MYSFLEIDKSELKKTVLDLNGLNENDLDVSSFTPDLFQESFLIFKEKLLEYSDKRFLIVGDYDCDGICATTIIRRLLDHLKIRVNYYIPSRIKEGYGLNEKIVNMASENGFDVILTVDNGIVANQAVSLAYELGLKVMVIDHHEYEKLPECDAVIHPKLLNMDYENMCGGGLCALLSMMFWDDPYSIVLGGLATLGDMVRVFGFNRYILNKMLEALNAGDIYQINLLADTTVYSFDVLSFKVIPKLNAVSRMGELGNVNLVVRYLLSGYGEAISSVSYINSLNEKRKNYTAKMADDALKMIDAKKKFIVVKSNRFMEGLCGLIANRLMSMFGKPVIVLAESEGKLRGSGRSPEGFDLYECLSIFKDEYDAFGGHSNAVGLAMNHDIYNKLLDYLENVDVSYIESNKTAIVLKTEDIDIDVIEMLESLRPFGTGFKEPLFALNTKEATSFFRIKGIYPKYAFGSTLSAISFDNRTGSFEKIIGKLNRDNYRKGAVSMAIEDFI